MPMICSVWLQLLAVTFSPMVAGFVIVPPNRPGMFRTKTGAAATRKLSAKGLPAVAPFSPLRSTALVAAISPAATGGLLAALAVALVKIPGLLAKVMGAMMDGMMTVMASPHSGGMRSPLLAKLMQPIMRFMMNKSMKVTEHDNDPTYKEVQDFMVPASSGKPFEDAPGTFDPTMEPRMKEVGFFGLMEMYRKGMEAAGAPHNLGITWDKFNEHRGYATPGYVPKHPMVGEVVPDGKILSIDGGEPSTLLTEARKLADAAGSDKVILAFDAITCPFYRAYAAEDLHDASNGVPSLHVYLREAEPSDVFDAGGMHLATPLQMKRPIPWHKSEAERADAAADTRTFLESFMGKGQVPMWMDTMDDNLEALYEARPWRQYVIEAATGKLLGATGLAPFNMAGKIKVIEEACA